MNRRHRFFPSPLSFLLWTAGFVLPAGPADASSPSVVVVSPSDPQGIQITGAHTGSVTTMLLEAPARLVVDIAARPGVDKSAVEAQLPKEIRSVRVGFHEGYTRIVFDLSGETLPQLEHTRSALSVSFNAENITPLAPQAPLITRLSFREILSLSRKARRPQDL